MSTLSRKKSEFPIRRAVEKHFAFVVHEHFRSYKIPRQSVIGVTWSTNNAYVIPTSVLTSCVHFAPTRVQDGVCPL